MFISHLDDNTLKRLKSLHRLFSFQIIYLLISNSVSYHGMVIDLIDFPSRSLAVKKSSVFWASLVEAVQGGIVTSWPSTLSGSSWGHEISHGAWFGLKTQICIKGKNDKNDILYFKDVSYTTWSSSIMDQWTHHCRVSVVKVHHKGTSAPPNPRLE